MDQALDRRTLIGTAERVDLPEWGVRRLRAKIDTGARTSALHVDDVEEIGEDRVRFSIVLHRDERDERVTVETPIVRRGRVRSSTGRAQTRIFVSTRVVVGGVEKEVEISLASRRRMIYRMLLGRSALESDFLVDPSRRYVATAAARDKRRRRPKKRAGEDAPARGRSRARRTPSGKRARASKRERREAGEARTRGAREESRKRRGEP